MTLNNFNRIRITIAIIRIDMPTRISLSKLVNIDPIGFGALANIARIIIRIIMAIAAPIISPICDCALKVFIPSNNIQKQDLNGCLCFYYQSDLYD